MFRSITNKYIKPSSLVLVVFLNFILFFISTYGLYRHFANYRELEEKYKTVEALTLQSLNERKEKTNFSLEHKNADANFITDFFENKKNLIDEQSSLKYLSKLPFFYKNAELASKLAEIAENNFKFQIGELFQAKKVKEKKIILKNPVRCSYEDLNDVLSRIEPSQGKPQIIPSDIHVEFGEFDCVFDCKLLQREFD